MQTCCSTLGLIYPKEPDKDIEKLSNAGFKQLYLDFSMFYSTYELEIKDKIFVKDEMDNEKPSKTLNEFKENAKDFIIKSKGKTTFVTAIAPCLAEYTKRDDLNDFVKQLAIESIKLSAEASCKYIIIEPLKVGVKDEIFENKEYYLELGKYAKENNITILIKNQYKNFNGKLTRGLFSTPEKIIDFINFLNDTLACESFGFCLDMGVCIICKQDICEFIRAMNGYTKAIIMRESDRYKNTFMLPFTNVMYGKPIIDWVEVIKLLRKPEYDIDVIIFDIRDTLLSMKPYLKNQMLQFAGNMANYMKLQFELDRKIQKAKKIVLFGAGNMCKNYMEYYGKKYPPLFTCDNNSSLWGIHTHGLMVKNPKELKRLDDDCVIFICNMYYDEISQQLKKMGIKNKIEYFNDEYLFNDIF